LGIVQRLTDQSPTSLTISDRVVIATVTNAVRACHKAPETDVRHEPAAAAR
jgi:hypothetical protein